MDRAFLLRSLSLCSVISVLNVVYALLRGAEKIPSQNNWLSTVLILHRENHGRNADKPMIITELFDLISDTYQNPCGNVPFAGNDKCAARFQNFLPITEAAASAPAIPLGPTS